MLRKQDATAPHSVLLVLDATTGQNAMQQVHVFKEMVDVTGLVVTKLDGSARGGIVVALAEEFGLPVHAVGVGEQAGDLRPFDPRRVRAGAGRGVAATARRTSAPPPTQAFASPPSKNPDRHTRPGHAPRRRLGRT